MLENRSYMRPDGSRGPLTTTATLTIVMVVAYALQAINHAYVRSPVEGWMALTPYGVRHGWVWQLLTFQFLHGDLMHIVFNLIGFWFLGHFCENVLGRTRFLIAYFGCGAVGGLLHAALMLAVPSRFAAGVVGASAGVMGLLAIFALLERDAPVRFNFILPIRAIVLLYIMGGISLFFTLVPDPREMGVAHSAHLGGLLAGVAWIRLGWHHDYVVLPWEGWLGRWRERRSASGARRRVESAGWTPTIVKPGESRDTDFMSREIDPILEKISAHGIQSLTEQERRTLEAARARMDKH